MFLEWLQNLMGGSKASPMPHPDDFTTSDKYTFAEKRWKLQEEERRKRQQMYQEMAQTPGDTPAPYKSRMGTREAGDPFSPVQVAGGPPPSDVMARFGRPKKWPYLQSIVNMGPVA